MAPDLRLVKGEQVDDLRATFAPDRMIPTRFAQLSFVLALVLGLIAFFAFNQPNQSGLQAAFWLGCGLQAFLCIWGASAAFRRAALQFTLTSQRLEIERGLLAKRRESLDLFRIRDVVLEQGFIQRLRGLGTITLFSTDQVEPTLVIPSIANAQTTYELLRDAASRARQQRVVQVDG
jgi:membrane protein YdbS with pleckstrin-like domain